MPAKYRCRAEDLQRAEIIGITELAAQPIIDQPVSAPLGFTEIVIEVSCEIDTEAIIVEQGVVDIEQEDDLGRRQHVRASSGLGSCQRKSPVTMPAAADGPQLPGT